MEYECGLMPLSKLLVSPNGVVEPLCTSCHCADCTNPIRKIVISELGINKSHRLYVTAYSEFMAVMECPGYIHEQDIIEEDEFEEE